MGYVKYFYSFVTSFFLYLLSFSWLGGDAPMLRLMVGCMVLDYASGVILCMFFHKSQKTSTGGYSSREGLIGIIRKIMMLCVVWVAYKVQMVTGMSGLRDIIVMAFIVNEIVSIIENLGLMGVYIPAPLKKAIDILQDRVDNYPESEGKDDNSRKEGKA